MVRYNNCIKCVKRLRIIEGRKLKKKPSNEGKANNDCNFSFHSKLVTMKINYAWKEMVYVY